jgi:hypothetical protein
LRIEIRILYIFFKLHKTKDWLVQWERKKSFVLNFCFLSLIYISVEVESAFIEEIPEYGVLKYVIYIMCM